MAIEPPYIGPADQDMYNARPMVDGRKVLCNGTVVKWDGPVHEVFAPIYKEAGSTEKVLIGTLADLGEAECLKALDAAVASWKSGRGEWAQVTLLRSFLSFSLLIEIDAPHLPRPSVRPSVRPPARPSVRPPARPLAHPLAHPHPPYVRPQASAHARIAKVEQLVAEVRSAHRSLLHQNSRRHLPCPARCTCLSDYKLGREKQVHECS